TTGNTDIVLTEVLEFDNNFYAGVKEKSTGTHAFELLVNKYTGAVVPEMGPNMMWNTKYGHMTLNTQESSTVTEKQAIEIAQKYLDTELPGTEVEDADTFYGYYTLEVKKDDKLYGMLSVNANTGAVWYHNWHGTFIKILEVK
ncbi:MAG: PepSY domain-containing protein, partial [Euryarchaeota archaeon]|nr:PepSY domain-containing protein [Euryarchaeota archaeon]